MTTTFLAEFWTCVIDKKFAGVRAHPHHHNHHCHSHSQPSSEPDSTHPRLSGEGPGAAKCHRRTAAEDSKNGRHKPGKVGSPSTGSSGSRPHIRNSPESGKDTPASSDNALFSTCYEQSSIQKRGVFNRIFRRVISQNNSNCFSYDENGEDECCNSSGKAKSHLRREGACHRDLISTEVASRPYGSGSSHSCLCCSGSSCSDHGSDDSDFGSLFYLSSDEDSVNELLPEYFANENTVISLKKSELPSARNILASSCDLMGLDSPGVQIGDRAASPPSAVLIKEELASSANIIGSGRSSCLLDSYAPSKVGDLLGPAGDGARGSSSEPGLSQPASCNTKSESVPPQIAASSPILLDISEQGSTGVSPVENVPIPDNKHADLYVDPPKDIVGKMVNSGGLKVLEASGKALTVKCDVDDSTPRLSAAAAYAARPSTLPRSVRGAQILKHTKRSYIVGKGATAVVKLCDTIDTDKKYAIKEFRKRKKCETKREYIKKLVAEFCISSSLKDENVVSTIDLVQGDRRQWCVIMEYCPGGDLYTRINSGTLTSPSEINCYLKQLVNGVSYLHSMGVAHRDLKPENLLLSGDGSILKIADFGVSAVFRGPFCSNCRKTKGLCGSGPYISPEQFTQLEYDPRMADVWSIAIVYYVMVYGAAPWKDATALDPRFKKYSENPPSYPPVQRLRPGPRSLILKMLNPDVSKRCGVESVPSHEWFKLIPVCSETPDPGKPPPAHEHYKFDHNDYY